MSTETKFDSWALVELFGHQRIVGRVTEATLAGGTFIRVDVPPDGVRLAFTRFFGPSAIYGISPLSELVAMELLKSIRLVPVNNYELPKLTCTTEGDDDLDERDM